MYEKIVGHRLEYRRRFGSESFRREFVVHHFDHEVEPQRLSLPLRGHTGGEPRVSRARRGHASLAKEFICQGLAEAGIIPEQTVKSQFIQATEFLAWDELVQVHFVGAIRLRQRTHVAFDPRCDVGEGDAAELKARVSPVEFKTEHTYEAAAPRLGIAQEHQSFRANKIWHRADALELE